MPSYVGITVNDVDRTVHFVSGSLQAQFREGDPGRIQLRLRSRIDEFSYDIPDYRPTEGDQVAIFWGGVRFATCLINHIKTTAIAPKWVGGVKQLYPMFHDLDCVTPEWQLAHRHVGVFGDENGAGFVAGTWQTLAGSPVASGDIVKELFQTYATVDASELFLQAGIEIGTIVFGLNGPVTAWSAIKQLGDRNNHIAYVDAELRPHFEPRGSTAAPFAISTTSPNYRNLVLTTERQPNYHNRQIRRTNYKTRDPEVEHFAGDGTTHEFEVAGQVAAIETMYISSGPNRTEQNFGVKDVNTNKVSWFFQPGFMTISGHDTVPPLLDNETLSVEYRKIGGDIYVTPNVPAGMIVERFVDDLDSVSYEDATDAADREMAASQIIIKAIDLETDTHWQPNCFQLFPGQFIAVEQADVGVNEGFYVSSVNISDNNSEPGLLRVRASLTSQLSADAVESSADPRRKSGAENLKEATGRGGSGKNPPQQLDVGTSIDAPVENVIFGVGVGEPAVVEDDVTLHRGVYSNGTPFECMITIKVPGVSSATAIDIQYTEDDETWTSIFPTGGTPLVPIGETMPMFFSTFADGVIFKRGGKLRCDITAADGTVQDIHVLLRWRRLRGQEAGDTDLQDGDSDTLPFH